MWTLQLCKCVDVSFFSPSSSTHSCSFCVALILQFNEKARKTTYNIYAWCSFFALFSIKFEIPYSLFTCSLFLCQKKAAAATAVSTTKVRTLKNKFGWILDSFFLFYSENWIAIYVCMHWILDGKESGFVCSQCVRDGSISFIISSPS